MIDLFLIVGTGRIGSLSLARALNDYSFISSFHETMDNARCLSNQRWDGEISNIELIRSVGNSLRSLRRKGGSNIVIDSNCLNWNLIDIIEEIDGNVGYIYIKRGMEDTVKSMVDTDFYGSSKMPWELRAKKGFYNIEKDNYGKEEQYRNCLLSYCIRNNVVENSLDSVENKRKLLLNFEDMLIDKTTYLGRIQYFIERLSGKKFEKPINLKHFHKTK
ncbi:MAG: hypothetical protein ACXAAH_08380 [Promethearchaeota archaeon]|jgi:hypothetical protein